MLPAMTHLSVEFDDDGRVWFIADCFIRWAQLEPATNKRERRGQYVQVIRNYLASRAASGSVAQLKSLKFDIYDSVSLDRMDILMYRNQLLEVAAEVEAIRRCTYDTPDAFELYWHDALALS